MTEWVKSLTYCTVLRTNACSRCSKIIVEREIYVMALMKPFVLFTLLLVALISNGNSFTFNPEKFNQLPAHKQIWNRQNFYEIRLPKKIPLEQAVKQVLEKNRFRRDNAAPPPAANGTSVVSATKLCNPFAKR